MGGHVSLEAGERFGNGARMATTPKRPVRRAKTVTKKAKAAKPAKPGATVASYLARQPVATRRVLEDVRRLLRRTLPGAEECISYGIPALRVGGRVALFFAGWKDHWSLYPVSAAMLAVGGPALEAYRASKGTLKFPLDRPIPEALLRKAVTVRAGEILALGPLKR